MTAVAAKGFMPLRIDPSKIVDDAEVRSSLPLETFHYLVNKCAHLRLDQEIANGSADHARILIAKLFEIARYEVRLMSGQLRTKTDQGVEIYGHKPVVAAAQKFLRDPTASLSITVQSGEIDADDKNIFLKSIVEDQSRKGKVIVYIPARGELEAEDTPHYMVADREAYRLETFVDDRSTPTMVGVANFGDPGTAVDLIDLYDETVAYLERPETTTVKRIYLAGEVIK